MIHYSDYIDGDDNEEEAPEWHGIECISLDDVSSRLLPPHQRCVVHLLNLLTTSDVTQGIKKVESIKLTYTDVITKCTKLWHLTRSPKSYEKIVRILGRALKRPVVTRWNSLYDAFKQLIELKEKILALLEELQVDDSLTDSDFM